jgi:uncharacterized membrane protein YjgN (DUF898 family)
MADDGSLLSRNLGRRKLISYQGSIGGLYRIYIPNLLLTIVTLGIWRFWGVTRMRRYVWANTEMDGDRFEYDGTGLQLFLSFLLAGLVLVGMVVVAGVVAVLLGRYNRVLAGLPVAVLYLAIMILGLSAPFSAQRYRLSHSLWRGIRGGMAGSAIQYGMRSLAYFLFAGVTLYQLLPWATLRLRERLINASYLGDLQFTSHGRAWRLYFVFLATFIGVIALAAVIALSVWTLDAAGLQAMSAMARVPRGTPPDPELVVLSRHTIYYVLAGYAALAVGGALISCAYTAAFWRHLLGHTSLGGLDLGSDVRALDVLALAAGNLAILVCTLGLGAPVVVHRNLRFTARHLLVTGVLDSAAIRQSDRVVSGMGEGMFQQLDAGAGLV